MLEGIEESVIPFKSEELSDALERHRNAEVFRVDTPRKVLDRAMLLVLHEYPEDFWDKDWGRLAQLDPEQVAAASRRHIDAARLDVVAVGPADVLEPQLAELGEVVRLDRESAAEAQTKWLNRLFEAVGERSRWAEAEGVEYLSEMTGLAVAATTARSQTWISFQDASSRTQTEVAGSTTTMVIGPRTGWARTPITLTEFPAEICERARSQARSNLYRILKVLAVADPADLSLDDEGRLSGSLPNGARFFLEVGEDGYPSALMVLAGGGEALTRYSDWSEIDGVAFAKRSTQIKEPPIERHLSGFVLHEELDEELFQEP